MTKLTTAQMRDELDRERAARIYQEKEIAELRYLVEDLRGKLANVTEVASALNTMPQWQRDRAAAMAAAKQLAVSKGKTVRV
ncbi:hypothetical protein [Herminiimonas sp. CN]|uniref:hypothetical protein n=1 Tax=Herminiimonas sp. CN TaxID=1349818 RepID=UPI0004734FA8|nr:hypothetical protein [Herminiimonas sp. CN]